MTRSRTSAAERLAILDHHKPNWRPIRTISWLAASADLMLSHGAYAIAIEEFVPLIQQIVRDWRRHRSFYLFVSPYAILTVVFMIFPLLFSFDISFYNWSGMGGGPFVGLDNYIRLFRTPLFWQSLYNTVYIWVGSVPLQLAVALILAVFLNQTWLKARHAFRAALFLPAITSLVIVALVFSMILDQNFGLLNLLLHYIGISPVAWLTTPEWSKISLVILILWRWTGYQTVLMLAGLQRIPGQLYEASRIDGASEWRSFFAITIPLMRPILLFGFVMGMIGSFASFAEPYILTSGGPANSSLTTGLYLYQEGFEYFHFGAASAIAWFLFVVTLALSLVQMRWLSD